MSWVSRVVCEHSAVLGRAPTVDAWRPHGPAMPEGRGCEPAASAGDWLVGVRAGSDAARARVLELLRPMSADALPVGSAVARLTRADLPACSVLLSDGELAAGLAWGEPLSLAEIGAWEYVLSAAPLPDHPGAVLAPGTIAVLDSCGPTVFRVPHPQETP